MMHYILSLLQQNAMLPFLVVPSVLIFACGVASLILFIIKKKFIHNLNLYQESNLFLRNIFMYLRSPAFVLIAIFVLYLLLQLSEEYYPLMTASQTVTLTYLFNLLSTFATFWMILNLLRLSRVYLLSWSNTHQGRFIALLIPIVTTSLKPVILLAMLSLLIPQLGLTGVAAFIIAKIIKILFIATLTWIFFQIVNGAERMILNQYVVDAKNPFTARKLQTQVLLLKKIILSLGMLVAVAAILMSFENVRNIGTGILTTAGLLSAVGAFASQQSLSRLFAGLQLAFTQPIRIGDTVIIDNEFGQIEEITLSYVVIKLWDLRRLIKPTDYFTSTGLQNLTRESSQLLGTIYIYADYTLPVDKLREKLEELLNASHLWDKKVCELEVTDITEKTLQIRALMSADNASTLWKLRCEIREKLIRYLVDTYPECLATSRQISFPAKPLLTAHE